MEDWLKKYDWTLDLLLLEKSENISDRSNIPQACKALAMKLVDIGEFDKAIEMANSALSIRIELRDQTDDVSLLDIADDYSSLGQIYWYCHSSFDALEHYVLAQQYILQSPNTSERTKMLQEVQMHISSIKQAIAANDEVFDCLMCGRPISQQVNANTIPIRNQFEDMCRDQLKDEYQRLAELSGLDKEGLLVDLNELAEVYHTLSISLCAFHLYDEAENMAWMAITTRQRVLANNPQMDISIFCDEYLLWGRIHESKGKYDKAISMFKVALDLVSSNVNEDQSSRIKSNIANDLVGIYYSLNQKDEAKKYAQLSKKAMTTYLQFASDEMLRQLLDTSEYIIQNKYSNDLYKSALSMLDRIMSFIDHSDFGICDRICSICNNTFSLLMQMKLYDQLLLFADHILLFSEGDAKNWLYSYTAYCGKATAYEELNDLDKAHLSLLLAHESIIAPIIQGSSDIYQETRIITVKRISDICWKLGRSKEAVHYTGIAERMVAKVKS